MKTGLKVKTFKNAALSCGRAKTETFENGVAPSLQGRAFQDGGQTLDNCRFYFAVDFKTNICSTNAQYDKAAGFYDCLNTRVKRLRKKSKRTSKS